MTLRRSVDETARSFEGAWMMRNPPFAVPSLALLASALLCACGADTVGAATSSATAAAAAAQQAKEQKAQIEGSIKAMQDSEIKRVEGISEQADGASH